MGQIVVPGSPPSIILSAVDRLVAANADGGVSPLASHIILFGEDAGMNLGDLDGVIVLGGFALDAGLADSDLHGTIAIGLNTLTNLTSGTNNDTPDSGLVVIGDNAGAALASAGDSVIIGANALRNYVGAPAAVGLARSVIIGNAAMERLTGSLANLENTVIGWRSGRMTAGSFNFQQNVFVGDQIASAGAQAVIGNTVVGASAGTGMASGGISACQRNVVIGQQAGAGLDFGDDNVLIGTGCGVSSTSSQTGNVVLGTQALAYGSFNTILGIGATNAFGGGVAGEYNILLGYQAGITWPNNRSNFAAIEIFTQSGGVQRSCLFADMDLGNVTLGRSTETVDRELTDATNTVKILNGTPGTVAPTGGGRFFVQGGQLRWLDTTLQQHLLTVAPNTVASLATLPAVQGQRAFVTNALAPAFGAAVAAGGAVVIPVFYNGAIWIVG